MDANLDAEIRVRVSDLTGFLAHFIADLPVLLEGVSVPSLLYDFPFELHAFLHFEVYTSVCLIEYK